MRPRAAKRFGGRRRTRFGKAAKRGGVKKRKAARKAKCKYAGKKKRKTKLGKDKKERKIEESLKESKKKETKKSFGNEVSATGTDKTENVKPKEEAKEKESEQKEVEEEKKPKKPSLEQFRQANKALERKDNEAGVTFRLGRFGAQFFAPVQELTRVSSDDDDDPNGEDVPSEHSEDEDAGLDSEKIPAAGGQQAAPGDQKRSSFSQNSEDGNG